MTQPRQILPGATVFITRRTIRRHHLFVPGPEMNAIFLYALAVSAKRFEMLVHLAMLMCTHEHLTVTDQKGRLPEFLQFFHRCVALATKALRGWEGPVWDHEKTSVVSLVTPEAIIQTLAYSMANPVAAGLVACADQWPGVTARPDVLGRLVVSIPRPRFWFSPENPEWPDVAELVLTLPPSLAQMGSVDQLQAFVAAEVARLSGAAHAVLRAERRSFLGPDRCEQLSPYERTSSREPLRSLNPTVAAGPGRHAERAAARKSVRTFRHEYRERLLTWRAGERDTPFPAGTWLMCRRHGAPVVPAGAA